ADAVGVPALGMLVAPVGPPAVPGGIGLSNTPVDFSPGRVVHEVVGTGVGVLIVAEILGVVLRAAGCPNVVVHQVLNVLLTAFGVIVRVTGVFGVNVHRQSLLIS